MLSFLLLLVAVALFFVFIDQALLAGLCILAALFIALANFLGKTGKTAKSTGKALTKGMGEQAGKAEAESPDSSILEEGLGNAADLAGQQAFAPDKYQFKFRGLGALGETSQRLIDWFKKAFK